MCSNLKEKSSSLSAMSNSYSEEATASSGSRAHQDYDSLNTLFLPFSPALQLQSQPKPKRKRGQPGNPDPDAEVIALSPKTLMATNTFVCEICNKGFQRDQNLQLHRRGHNLPWKLRQRSNNELIKKKAYVCPEASCVHHQPSRALGDLTGIKKHYSRKHGEKKWKCERCSKGYAVHSDWKAHVKTCGTREYRCDCGILFTRKDSFITHRAFCDALAEESARLIAASNPFSSSPWDAPPNPNFHLNPNPNPSMFDRVKSENPLMTNPNYMNLNPLSPPLTATTLLQQACIMGPTSSAGHQLTGPSRGSRIDGGGAATWQKGGRLTRDFLGMTAGDEEEEELTRPLTSLEFGLPAATDDECPCCFL